MRKWLKRAAKGVGILAALVAIALTVVYVASERKLDRQFSTVALRDVAVPSDPAAVERGRHLASAIGKCTDCHGQDLGGQVFIDAMPMGRLIASNLTTGKGGALGRYTNAQLERLIRHGVKDDGRGVLFMPSEDYAPMSDADVGALIAYLRTLPPVDRELPRSTVGPLGRALYLGGQLPLLAAEKIDHDARPAAPPAGVTREYGKYLADVGGCTGCHRPDLSGGHVPGTPPDFKDAANLTPAGDLAKWTEADFFRALRTGVRPDGRVLDEFMPWKSTAKMSDDEIRAVWLYLRSVPPAQTRKS